jgi:uncharacterized membrane protein YfcA
MLYTLSGFLIGFLIGLTGVGGGSLMTPLLILIFKIPATIAVGTDLLYASITKSAGLFSHHRNNNIDWSITKTLLLGSIPSSLLTSFVINIYDPMSAEIQNTIELVLGISLIFTSIAVLFQQTILIESYKVKEKYLKNSFIKPMRKYLTILTGLILGFIVTFTSVGAGAIGVTVLLILNPSLPIKKVIGTDIAHAIPLTLIAGLGHAKLGTVNYDLLVALLLGSLPGVWLGSQINSKINEKTIRLILVLILFLISLKLLGLYSNV